MIRDRINDLKKWRIDPYRKPLILRGCRQVGKSWLINEFGKEFDQFVVINFEKNKLVHQYFETDLDIPTILEKISLHTNIKIIPGKTLIFFDEIQECPKAIVALRYFYEQDTGLYWYFNGSAVSWLFRLQWCIRTISLYSSDGGSCTNQH
mgnify:CR=1 FL=1